MAKLLRGYLRAMEKFPLATQAVSAGVLMATGDAIAQLGVEQKTFRQFETERTFRFFTFGALVVGPVLKGWYAVLDKVVKTGSPTVMALKKVGLDQLTFAPGFCAFFLSAMTYWKTKSVEDVKAKLKQDYIPVIITNYKLWPAAQVINFYFVPLQWRVIYVQFVAIIWNTYLAYKTEQHTQESESLKIEEVQKS